MPNLLDRVMSYADKGLDYQVYTDAKNLLQNTITAGEIKKAIDYTRRLTDNISNGIRKLDVDEQRMFYGLHKDLLLQIAKHDFDAFCQVMEWNREPERKFYLPRRKQLKPLAEAMMMLYYDELDLLCISMPPGTGKTTLALFFLAWWGGNNPIEPFLTCSHSSSFLDGAYSELLRLLSADGEYLYHEIFPESPVVKTNAKDMMIDLRVAQRFSTYEFTSIGASNAGKVRSQALLYCDDLVDGLESAMSRDRMDKLWEQYTVDLRQRKIGRAKELHIATRWSIHDPIGRLQELNEKNPRAKFISEAALDDNDESRFDYPYEVGHSTEALLNLREAMEEASWRALYMNEPIERDGQLYAPAEMRRFFELPDRDADAVVAVCDTKDKGSDFCVLPVGVMYGDDVYIVDCVCDDGKPEIVEEKLAMMLTKYKVQMAQFESNSAGGKIAEKVQKRIKEKGGITNITTKYTTSNKETKILANSPYVKEHFLFLDDSVLKNNKEYRTMLRYLFGYTLKGKNRHDDVPDAFAQMSLYIQGMKGYKPVVFRRPF